ncbi:glycosyltransferase, partial [Halomonas sp. SIMBA_159]
QAAALPGSFSPERALVERVAARAGNPPVFLYVGRLSEEKGIGTLIEAFAGLRKRIPAAQLRIVGTGPMADALHAKVAELQLTGAVTFAGS